MTKGGNRPGAGRKPSPHTMIRVAISLTPEQYAWLKAQDASMGETVRKLIENEIKWKIIQAAQMDAAIKSFTVMASLSE